MRDLWWLFLLTLAETRWAADQEDRHSVDRLWVSHFWPWTPQYHRQHTSLQSPRSHFRCVFGGLWLSVFLSSVNPMSSEPKGGMEVWCLFSSLAFQGYCLIPLSLSDFSFLSGMLCPCVLLPSPVGLSVFSFFCKLSILLVFLVCFFSRKFSSIFHQD